METEELPVVLIIDDDTDILEILDVALADEGFSTQVASSGIEGLKRFQTTRPDLVILDLLMPGMDGLETLRRLRQASDCPVIMLTGYGTAETFLKATELGVEDYVAKPVQLWELVDRVQFVPRRAKADEQR